MLKKTFAFATVAAVVLTVAASGTTAVRAETRDVVDTAIAAGSFKTLAKALDAAGLVNTLKGAGPFTVFAPTDEAFAKLPDGTLETLLKPSHPHVSRRGRQGHGLGRGEAEVCKSRQRRHHHGEGPGRCGAR